MEIKVELDSKSLTEGLLFTEKHMQIMMLLKKIGDLSIILEDVFFELTNLNYQVEGRNEFSAKSIKKRLNQLEKYLNIKLTFEEETE